MKSLYHRYTSISAEKKLALKISGVSFMVLIGIVSIIISMSYFGQVEKSYREFRDEIKLFEGGRMSRGIEISLSGNSEIPAIPFLNGDTRRGDNDRGPRGPRDILVFSDDRTIIQNDFLQMDDSDIDELYDISNGEQGILYTEGHKYLIYRKDIGTNTLFLTRDMKQIEDFHEWLMILAALGSIVGLIIIYFLSIHLARLVIEPIREHNASLTAYSHNVAHELKTPLAVMRSNMELLKLTPSEKLISSTEEEVVSMEHIIDTLLLLANPNKHLQENEKVELIPLTEKILENYPEDDIDFIHPKQKIYLECAPEYYKRILANLIENALKYKSEGVVMIKLNNNKLIIQNQVYQNLSEIEIQKLTEVFYQADTSRASSGQGLGLALVEKIVKLYGWHMEFYSEKNIFRVEIQWK